MSFVSIVDAWMSDLVTNVTGLNAIPAQNQHKYAPWSREELSAQVGERHIAIWPEATQDAPTPFATGQLPTDIDVTSYAAVVWEDASNDAVRAQDDDTANAAWLTLAEDIQARFRVQSHTNLGETGAYTRLGSLTFGLQGTVRMMIVQFTVRNTDSFT